MNKKKEKLLIIFLLVFFVLYLLLFFYTSNYKVDNGIPILDIRLNKKNSLDDIHNNSKKIKYENNLLTIDNNKYDITIKGRGNYTWTLPKRPYQISFEDKTSLFDYNKTKKYVLLANYLDPSLLKNDFTYSVAKKMNLNYSNTGEFIDLYIDKKYLGNYYLIPKVAINDSSVNLKDDNAIIMELDNMYYEEETYFVSNYFKDHITIKDQKNENEESYTTFQNKYNLMEKNINDKNYKWLKKNIDIDSFVKYYIISDFAQNTDAYKSSLYFYMDGLDDQIHIGPIWDFDIGYGLLSKDTNNTNMIDSNDSSILFIKLLELKDFKKQVSTYWKTEACSIYKEEIEQLDSKIEYLNISGEMNSMYWNNKHYNEYTDEFKDWVTTRYKYYNDMYGCDVS